MSEANENKISVDELLRRKRERNEATEKIVRNNFQSRNQAIKKRQEAIEENLLLGEAQIELQSDLLDAKYNALVNFNDKYIAMTDKVIKAMDAETEARALEINSAVEVEYQLIEEIDTPILPPVNRFSNILFGSIEDTEIKSLPGLPSTSIGNAPANEKSAFSDTSLPSLD
jgi:hypothetical protein